MSKRAFFSIGWALLVILAMGMGPRGVQTSGWCSIAAGEVKTLTPDKDRKKKRSSSRKKDRSKKESKPEKKACSPRSLPERKGVAAELIQALSFLPELQDLPKGADRIWLTVLVKLSSKESVLLEDMALELQNGDWVWTGLKAGENQSGKRLSELEKAGVKPDPCPSSPDRFLGEIRGNVKDKKWENMLLASTWKRNPASHSLVDDILEDRKACGRSAYDDELKRIPKLGELQPNVWLVVLKYEVTGKKHGRRVEIGLVPTTEGWRVAHLRIICN